MGIFGGSAPKSGPPGYVKAENRQFILPEGRSLYDQGGPQFYPGQTWNPLNPMQMSGINNLYNRGMNGSPLMDAGGDWITQAMSGQGPGNQLLPTSMQYIQNTLNPTGSPGSSGYSAQPMGLGDASGFFQQGAQTLPGMQNMVNDPIAGRAAGDGYDNPYRDAMFQTASRPMTQQFNEQIMPGLNASFGGSANDSTRALMAGAASGRLTDSLGDIQTNLMDRDYARERGYQVDAQNRMQSGNMFAQNLYDQARGRDLGNAANLYAGDQSRNDARQINALNAAGRYYGIDSANAQAAAGMAPTYANQDYRDIAAQMGAGDAMRAQSDLELGEDIRRHDYNQQLPYQNLNWYNQLVNGMPNQPYSQGGSPWQQGIGGALMGGAAGASMFPAAAGATPWGAFAGAGLGLLGSFL